MNEEFKYMKDSIAADLIEYLVADYKLCTSEALNVLYESETFSKLSDSATGLYFQSSKYVYTFLQNELETGVLS